MLTWNTSLRPKRSASIPERAAPRNMPTKLMLESSPAWAVERPNSVLIEPRRKVSEPRSIESKNQAVAMIRKIVRWNPVIGRRSRRAAIITSEARAEAAPAATPGIGVAAGRIICPVIVALPGRPSCARSV
ncbi:hypothetical protein MPOCJGCO_4325 [Methylobacterium trifolii]|uniref:Uncharacterized protein n=1 Tax=Methylobacterium trifolii TaxID=1003092 RepID=A0ABQ4U8V6_9HYPH|nr:hypothetical protein MPOCJGCO_4325 [Methylobacterium trifolii]